VVLENRPKERVENDLISIVRKILAMAENTRVLTENSKVPMENDKVHATGLLRVMYAVGRWVTSRKGVRMSRGRWRGWTSL
jgi:hypothetical protein